MVNSCKLCFLGCYYGLNVGLFHGYDLLNQHANWVAVPEGGFCLKTMEGFDIQLNELD